MRRPPSISQAQHPSSAREGSSLCPRAKPRAVLLSRSFGSFAAIVHVHYQRCCESGTRAMRWVQTDGFSATPPLSPFLPCTLSRVGLPYALSCTVILPSLCTSFVFSFTILFASSFRFESFLSVLSFLPSVLSIAFITVHLLRPVLVRFLILPCHPFAFFGTLSLVHFLLSSVCLKVTLDCNVFALHGFRLR